MSKQNAKWENKIHEQWKNNKTEEMDNKSDGKSHKETLEIKQQTS